jgi:microcystin-dependent protein
MGEPYVGEIRMVGFNFAPVGWMLCQGQLLPIAENETLFTLIGTTYGGDGQETFALPNLQSRVPMHQGSGFTLSEMGGVETVTLTVNQIPAHQHPPGVSSGSGSSNTPANSVSATWAGSQYSDQGITPNAFMNLSAMAPAGGSQPHDNMLPYLAINFIISLFGVFPSQT